MARKLNWNQLKTVLLLRWQLTRNQWSRSKYGLRGVLNILVIIATSGLAAVSFLGGYLGAIYGLPTAPPAAIMFVWLIVTVAFLFLWAVGLLIELQRSEAIDLQRLMHLPVRLGQIFLINYIASHFAFSLVIAVPASIGLSIGLALVRGPLMLLLLPLSLSMIFMVTAWTYCLRGWLAALMINPRRRRSVIVFLTLLFVLISQGPNIYFNVFDGARHRRALRQNLQTIEPAQKFIPPLWVPLGARSLAEGNPVPGLLGTGGCLILGALGLGRAYRSTLRFYYRDTSERATPVQSEALGKTARRSKPSGEFLEMRLPGVNQEASVVALASIRSMSRAPEVKMAWLMSFLVTVFVGASILFRSSAALSESVKPFVAPGATSFSFFMLFQMLGNLFGFDRGGFGTFVVSPVDRRMILLGKNIAALPVIMGSGLLLLVLAAIRLHLPPLSAVAGVFQIASMSIVACLFGNLLSILVPYRIQPASLKPTKIPTGTALLMLLCQFLFPIALLPIFVPPLIEVACRAAGMSAALPINVVLSIAVLAAAIFAYWVLIGPMGQLLQRREMKILQTVTAETE